MKKLVLAAILTTTIYCSCANIYRFNTPFDPCFYEKSELEKSIASEDSLKARADSLRNILKSRGYDPEENVRQRREEIFR